MGYKANFATVARPSFFVSDNITAYIAIGAFLYMLGSRIPVRLCQKMTFDSAEIFLFVKKYFWAVKKTIAFN